MTAREIFKEVKNDYKTRDGHVCIEKMICDLAMWNEFSRDYGLDKKGGIMLLRQILGDEEEFKNKYIR